MIGYLVHWKDNVHHDMLPIKQMDKLIEQAHDKQQEHSNYHHMSVDR
jgi:hypothetical protein